MVVFLLFEKFESLERSSVSLLMLSAKQLREPLVLCLTSLVWRCLYQGLNPVYTFVSTTHRAVRIRKMTLYMNINKTQNIHVHVIRFKTKGSKGFLAIKCDSYWNPTCYRSFKCPKYESFDSKPNSTVEHTFLLMGPNLTPQP